jgi:outer membrane biosynthesis protein TonB
MTQVDLHPEDLFDGLRAGVLPQEAHARLLSHCAHCEPCQFELRLIEGQSFALDDSAHSVQLAEAALRALSWPPPAPAQPSPARNGRIRQQLAAAAALLVLGFGFGAAAMYTSFPRALGALLGSGPHTPTLRHVQTAGPRALAPVAQPAAALVPPPTEIPETVPSQLSAPELAPPPSAAELPTETVSDTIDSSARAPKRGAKRQHARSMYARQTRASLPLTASPRTTRPFSEADAEAALSLATQARSTGYEGEAVERYRLVIERFPNTRAAGAAQVALGRLLYIELAQPSQALPLFEAYLARSGAHALAEEAMYHRGMCLIALRRMADASVSFGQLLELFPGSMYAAQARAQLSRLRGP